MIVRCSPRLVVGIALANRRTDTVDVAARSDADVRLVAGGDLPFADREVAALLVGDAVADLHRRDQIQLLAECRRVLIPGGALTLVEPAALHTRSALSHWASMMGFREVPTATASIGWFKALPPTDPEPLVSICIPSSNPRYFRDCVDSALAQTYRNVEIVICDDSEGPEIPAMAMAYADRAPVRFEQNPVRLLARKNFEKCLSLARGEFVKYLNDDDVLEPSCVANMVDAFQAVPDLTLATSHRWRIDHDSVILADIPATAPVVDRDLVIDGISLVNAYTMYGLNFVGEPSTAMFRRSDLDRKSATDDPRPFQFDGEEVRGAIDLAMWSRLLVQGNAVFFAERLSRFRVHPEQAQARADVVQRSIDGIRGLQHKWIASGLFRRCPPHLLRVQPLADARSGSADWGYVPMRIFVPPETPPDDQVRAWRAVERHPFDTERP